MNGMDPRANADMRFMHQASVNPLIPMQLPMVVGAPMMMMPMQPQTGHRNMMPSHAQPYDENAAAPPAMVHEMVDLGNVLDGDKEEKEGILVTKREPSVAPVVDKVSVDLEQSSSDDESHDDDDDDDVLEEMSNDFHRTLGDDGDDNDDMEGTNENQAPNDDVEDVGVIEDVVDVQPDADAIELGPDEFDVIGNDITIE
mmetsp:Transcript_20316/g.32516  ORF Transcript_20316/g.32516 Transcript_20316/m.32516 type:complete len:199 (+) Transcript_20316:1-597(+)